MSLKARTGCSGRGEPMAITQTEWAALIGVGGTLLAGATASLVTYWVTRRTVKSSEVEGKKQRGHDASERRLRGWVGR
jgi:hypothetical protein